MSNRCQPMIEKEFQIPKGISSAVGFCFEDLFLFFFFLFLLLSNLEGVLCVRACFSLQEITLPPTESHPSFPSLVAAQQKP